MRHVLVLALALILAACSTPRDTIESECRAKNENSDTCACLANTLEERLSDEQLRDVARAMRQAETSDEFADRLRAEASVDTLTTVGIVAKQCALVGG